MPSLVNLRGKIYLVLSSTKRDLFYNYSDGDSLFTEVGRVGIV